MVEHFTQADKGRGVSRRLSLRAVFGPPDLRTKRGPPGQLAWARGSRADPFEVDQGLLHSEIASRCSPSPRFAAACLPHSLP